LHSEKGLPTGASLFFAALPGIYSGRRLSCRGNPGLRGFHGERNSEIPAVLSLFPAVFAKKYTGDGRCDECRQRYFHYGLRDTYFANITSKTRFVNSMKSL
jgi:hypothetical protein